MRPLRPVARYRHIDEARIDLAQFLVAEPVLLGRAGAEVLAEDVGFRDQFFRMSRPSWVFRLSVTLLTPRLLVSKYVLGMPGKTVEPRELSPISGTSILMISAPRSAISM